MHCSAAWVVDLDSDSTTVDSDSDLDSACFHWTRTRTCSLQLDSDLDSDSRAVDLDSDSDSDIAGLVTSLQKTICTEAYLGFCEGNLRTTVNGRGLGLARCRAERTDAIPAEVLLHCTEGWYGMNRS